MFYIFYINLYSQYFENTNIIICSLFTPLEIDNNQVFVKKQVYYRILNPKYVCSHVRTHIL